MAQIFEFKRGEGPDVIKISNHVFCIKDFRPLYCWSPAELQKTSYDNWEPQFKPKELIEAEKLAAQRKANGVGVGVGVEGGGEGEDGDGNALDGSSNGKEEEDEDDDGDESLNGSMGGKGDDVPA